MAAHIEQAPKSKSLLSLPKSIDLSPQFPTPGNQGKQGSCVAWAVAYAAKSYQESLEHKWGVLNSNTIFSPSFVYNQINGGKDDGATIGNAMNLVVNSGICTMSQMPYSENNYQSQPNAAQKKAAYPHKSDHYSIAVGTEAVKTLLSQQTPVVISTPVYPDLDNLSNINPIYDNTNGTSRGSHALCLVGYDDSKQAFKFINSWGTKWGLSGYGYISYNLFSSKSIFGYYMVDELEDKVYHENNMVVGDFNGDGYDDIATIAPLGNYSLRIYVQLNNKKGGFTSNPGLVWYSSPPKSFSIADVKSRILAGDYNGDGKDDIAVMYDYGNAHIRIIVYQSNGSKFIDTPFWLDSGEGSFNANNVNGRLVSGDFNGDGKDDIANMYNYGNTEVRCFVYLSNGTTFTHNPVWLYGDSFNAERVTGRFTAGDFNGDGKDDIANMYDYGNGIIRCFVYLSNGSSFTHNPVWLYGDSFNASRITGRFKSGDFNGDGKDDIVDMYDYGNGTVRCFVYLSDGEKFNHTPTWYETTNFDAQRVAGRFLTGNFNGDKMDDFTAGYYYDTSRELRTFFSTGSSFI